jgi:hypothetical protein
MMPSSSAVSTWSRRDPKRFFDMAHGSAGEIRGALDVADACNPTS